MPDIELRPKAIADNPDIGRSGEAIRQGGRKRRVGRYVIIDRPIDGGVDVVRILHDRMDMDRHL